MEQNVSATLSWVFSVCWYQHCLNVYSNAKCEMIWRISFHISLAFCLLLKLVQFNCCPDKIDENHIVLSIAISVELECHCLNLIRTLFNSCQNWNEPLYKCVEIGGRFIRSYYPEPELKMLESNH